MKKLFSILSIIVVTNISAQTSSESSDGSKPSNNPTVNSIYKALNTIDSTFSAVALKIDNNVHDTANFANLRKKIEQLSNKLTATTQKIDKKLVNLFPEDDKKNNPK